jgi:hypothetical protein
MRKTMERAEIITRFNTLVSLGDALLQVVELRTGEAECRVKFDFARKLKAEGASIFDPEENFEPASLCLRGVQSIVCDGTYQLNSTVVDFGAAPSGDREFIEFYFELSGGTDPDAFLVKVKILATDFQLGIWSD